MAGARAVAARGPSMGGYLSQGVQVGRKSLRMLYGSRYGSILVGGVSRAPELLAHLVHAVGAHD